MTGVWVELFYFWLRGWCLDFGYLFDFVFADGSFVWWVRGLSAKLFWRLVLVRCCLYLLAYLVLSGLRLRLLFGFNLCLRGGLGGFTALFLVV